MQFLKTLFWVILAVVLVAFSAANWNTPQNGVGKVTIQLWGGLVTDIRLPFLVLVAFLLGFLPTFLVYRTRIWSLERRLETQNQAHVANMPAESRNVPPPPQGEARSNA